MGSYTDYKLIDNKRLYNNKPEKLNMRIPLEK